ncbi:conserved hypothetical protein [Carnobacterium maltaromaticum]|nr:conserved hypothetical protein [Carnobacterium maltaromaticum]
MDNNFTYLMCLYINVYTNFLSLKQKIVRKIRKKSLFYFYDVLYYVCKSCYIKLKVQLKTKKQLSGGSFYYETMEWIQRRKMENIG